MPSPELPNDETESEADSVFRTAITIEMGLGFVAILLGWITGIDVRQFIPTLETGHFSQVWSGLAMGVLAAFPMLLVVKLLERLDWEPIRGLKALEELPIVNTLLKLSAPELVAISIAAGVGEELLIRGWLMGWITGPLDTATPTLVIAGLVTSAIAFGLMHPITPAYAVIASFIGLYLGALVIWTGNLLVPIAAHAAYDAIHLVQAKRQQLADERQQS